MREAPEGAGSHTQLELIVMSIFYVLIPDIAITITSSNPIVVTK